MSWIRLFAGVLLLTGCAGMPTANYQTDKGLPRQVELEVPFYPQEAYQCGPAALAMAFAYDGLAVRPSELAREVYLPGKEGTLQVEMLAAARRAGLVPYVLDGNPDAMMKELAAGHPVVVLQNLGFGFLPAWHYAVVTGYNLPKKEVFLHSGTKRRLVIKLDDFDYSWSKSGRWAFVALPPQQLPASATEQDFVESVVELESVSPDSAEIAYQTALAKWPEDLIARIGSGNAAYALHDYVGAESEYRRATVDHPDSGDAWNNLAQVLHDLGRNRDALDAARRAVSLGGVRRADYEATLKAIIDDTSSKSVN